MFYAAAMASGDVAGVPDNRLISFRVSPTGCRCDEGDEKTYFGSFSELPECEILSLFRLGVSAPEL